MLESSCMMCLGGSIPCRSLDLVRLAACSLRYLSGAGMSIVGVVPYIGQVSQYTRLEGMTKE